MNWVLYAEGVELRIFCNLWHEIEDRIKKITNVLDGTDRLAAIAVSMLKKLKNL